MAEAKNGDRVQVHYTGRLDDGTVFDSSAGRETLPFTVGEGQVIPGFEQAVIGMTPGESKTVHIPADEAYGPRHPEMMLEVDRSEFPADMAPEIGQQLGVQQPDGQVVPVLIAAVNDHTVTLDANHPLAGEALTFDIQLVQIDPPKSRLISL